MIALLSFPSGKNYTSHKPTNQMGCDTTFFSIFFDLLLFITHILIYICAYFVSLTHFFFYYFLSIYLCTNLIIFQTNTVSL